MIKPGDHLEFVWASYIVSWGAMGVYLWYALRKAMGRSDDQGGQS